MAEPIAEPGGSYPSRRGRRRDAERDLTQDPQDKQFGAQAARDQQLVEDLEAAGLVDELEYAAEVERDHCSEEPKRWQPRAAGKALPGGEL
jgi:hypothetical protein